MNDKLEQQVREQAEQIRQLKQAIKQLEQMLKQVSQQSSRATNGVRKNANDIITLSAMIKRRPD